MRKLFFSIILLAFGLSAFAQSHTKYANFIPFYPPVVGESTYNNYVFNHNGLYLHDIIMDSLPHYEIQYIPDQTVRFLEDGIGFYVQADSLYSSNVVYSYTVDVPPIGPFEFNANTGRFKFYPDAGDYMPFTVTFTASAGGNSLSQDVAFTIMPEVVPEEYAIQSLGTMPSAQEYTIITETHWDTTLNNLERTVYSYSISGKEVVLDDLFPNTNILYNMYELNLFAERLYIRSALAFPHTNVNIYARELIFEDNGSEIASINTTPLAIGTETNVTGMNGENAGNITLHIKNLKADYAKRFILNGAKGQNANFNGTPGNGGNGGVLAAPISIEGYCDFARGSAGVKKDTLNSVIGAGQAGTNGHFELITDHYSWMHPYYIAAVIRHLNDAYLNDYFSYTKSTANDYYNLINEFETSDEWEDLDGTLRVELQDQTLELQSLLYRLNEGLDYFGNPSGWAPMLSFEVYMDIFDDEIDRSMPTLYLNYWLQQVDQSLANKIEAARVAAEQTEDDIDAVQGQINSLTEDIPLLEARITVLNSQIEEAQTHLEQLQAELMRKAKHNVKKKNRLNKAFGIATGVLNCIPVYGQIASAALTIGGSYFDLADTYGYSGTLSSTFEGVIGQQTKEKMENTKKTVDTIVTNNPNLGQTGHQLKENYYKFKNIVGPLTKSIINLQQTFAKSSAPNDQVQAEFKKLCSQSVEFKKLETKINALQQSYTEIMAVYNQTMNDIFNLTSEVSNEMVTLDALRGDVFQGNSRRDLQAMQCVEKMKQRAMNRLVKYHYYMRKAYEYRLLRPYQGDFSLETMYNRIETLINQGQIIFDNSTPANITDYSALSAVFRNEVSNVIEDVINELTITAPEQTATIPIVISREILDRINANEEYNLNLFELGVFMPDEDNLRIVDFGVQYIEAHTEGNVGMSTYMNIDLKHNGISRFRKNGEIYWFNHIPRSMDNPYPHTWSIRYNPLSQQTTAIGPSMATQSLLYSLLNGNAQNIMLFSRPAAWSDITMSKKVHSTGGADIVIDSLILTLQYDYTIRPNQIRYIDIAANENLMPYITCSEADRNGRSDGKGSFHRSYSRSGGSVTFTAMEKHGTYHFLNWTDRGGNVVSENTALTVNKMNDQYYRANYERWIPVISVADTIYVGNGGGEYVVQIQNIGQGDIEMDWYVSDSLSSWVHVDGVPEGIDDGYFTFTYEAMRSQDRRVDSLEILAPEIAGMSKMIYIVQDPTLLGVSASINPINAGTVVGTGFFREGNTCTLTATANEGYTFINWTKDGEEVSTEAVYSFTVTEDAAFVANFEATTVTQTITLTDGWNWFSTYIEADDLLEQLEESLGTSGIRIQGRNGTTDHFEYQGNSYWYGSLNAVANEQMYKIRTNAACNAVMFGPEAMPADHPITINGGWNWIGYPCNRSQSINVAMSGFTPEPNDVIKSRTATSTYVSYGSESLWYGTLNTMEPGQGYMYKSNSGETKTLVFQTGRDGGTMAHSEQEEKFFRADASDFADNMVVTAVVELAGEELRSEDYELAAFVGDECRGSVRLMYVEPFDRYIAFLLVSGESAEEMSFVLTDGESMSWSDSNMTFAVDGMAGTATNPVTLRFGTLGVDDNAQHLISIFPNPSNGIYNIEGRGIRKVNVVDAYGQVVLSKEIANDFMQIDLSNKAAGVYMLQVVTDRGITVRKLMKK